MLYVRRHQYLLFCDSVDLNMPLLDQIFTCPSSPASNVNSQINQCKVVVIVFPTMK